jgi:GMP reductase|tara:strand:- start:3888 stop:4922 length:1035 start_codon:yes stop_codon:yes gene_type:complete
MKLDLDTKLDFDDVLIKPKRSDLNSRSQVSLNRIFKFPHSTRELNCVPIMAANMDTTGSIAMNKILSGFDCITCLHKHYTSGKLREHFEFPRQYAFYSMGISEPDMEKLSTVYDNLQKKPNLCIDVANGYNEKFVSTIQKIREWYPDIIIMAGNVVTPEMTEELIFHGGVDIVKIGIGSGSVCTTRLKTGIGYPQLSAIIECADAAHSVGGHVCSDGGCTTPADICKAFCANADFVMLGGMLAGTDGCDGHWKYNMHREKESLQFYGMSSKQAMTKHNGGVADYRTSEGKCVTIPYKGQTSDTIQDILGGLRSCCTYIGAKTIKDMGKNTTFIKVNNTHNRIYS